jgi:tripartite-type tricarboxylate transporter receptor subunit TctC
MFLKFRCKSGLWLLLALTTHDYALAQTFPSKPLRMIVPFSAGSGTDILARTVAQKMAENWGQQVVVDNRPGAGGTIAAPIVINSNHDGHTLMMVSAGHAANATLYRKLSYDTLRDFVGVSLVASTPNLLVVGSALGVKSAKELIALAKSKPGQLNYSSAGIGSGTHLNGEQFKLVAAIDVTHIPFRGAPEALADVVAGRVHYLFTPIVVALPFIKDGRAIPLAVSSADRTPILPNVPTLAEAALPGFEFDMWFGILAPSKTPKATREKLSKEVGRIMQLPDVKSRIESLGGIPRTNTPDEFDAFIKTEVAKLGKVVKAGNAYAD